MCDRRVLTRLDSLETVRMASKNYPRPRLMATSPSDEGKTQQGRRTTNRFHALGFQMSSFSAAGSLRFWISNSLCVVLLGKNIWQAACQHRIAMTTNVNPKRPERAARNFGSSMTCAARTPSRHGRGPLARCVDGVEASRGRHLHENVKFKFIFGSESRTGSCHSTGCKPMTALFASVCMMYKPIKEPLPKMLWKIPV